MKIKSFPKTHYEHVLDYIKSSVNTKAFSDIISEQIGDDPSYEAFGNAFVDTFHLTQDDTPETVGSFLVNSFFHVYQMLRNQEKIYYVTQQLAAKLAQTDLNVDSHFIQSPFREIFIQVDPGLFSISDTQGVFPVRGFYVYLRNHQNTDIKEIRIAAVAILPPTEEIPFNDTFFYFKLYMGPGKVKDIVKKNLVDNAASREEQIRFGAGNNIDHIEEFAYFVFNTLLYITSKDPDIRAQLPVDFNGKLENKKSQSKIKKLQKMAGRSTAHTILVVGDSFKDDRNDFDDIKNAGGIGKWKLLSRVYVSGHWKMQWYGSSDKKESKHIFIAPYYKGPELAEVLRQKYQVGAV